MTFENFHPFTQAFLAGLFTWGLTSLGAAVIFATKAFKQKLMDSMLGLSGGIMIAASFWSLLSPAIEMSEHLGVMKWLPTAIGFTSGVLFLKIIDKILPHLHLGFPSSEAEGIKTSWKRSILLILAITLHNIPEGLAIGVAFGAISSELSSITLTAAITLTIGIGIQNIPEGFAVSASLRREGMSRLKSFWWGSFSGAVEPLAAILGAIAVFFIKPLLPYALAFAAGSMMFVVVEEVLPESQRNNNTDLATLSVMLGFLIMMILDVALG
ncbi:MAG TPA: ZIP family metal transporter [Candidatus Omnitrophota bacterium]|nr:ZIP family metal transporter [Candidatus Omnitrophota bacterium]HPN88364.1 ZIP family metal transporter [Candidatus Omnitrophota bacterium]